MIDIETLDIPTEGGYYVMPCIMGGLDQDWQVGWGYDGLTKPVSFYTAENSSDAIAVKRAIEDHIWALQAEIRRQAEERAKEEAEEEAKRAKEAKEEEAKAKKVKETK